MTDDGTSDRELGKIRWTNKMLAALSQIHASMVCFHRDEFECAVTLAGAAEGVIPNVTHPHMFALLRDSPDFEGKINLYINWTKHPENYGHEEIAISEFEVEMTIFRAISKFIAAYDGSGSPAMRSFVKRLTHWRASAAGAVR